MPLTTPRVSLSDNRISHLDGLRGIAILFVLLYHAYVRWANLVPYGSATVGFPPIDHGWAGVQLFFLISGYVIALTLERCPNAYVFLVRRWSRLFPAMLVVSLAIWLSAPLFTARPEGQPSGWSLIPGITFLEPSWWQKIIGPFPVLEGAFWSLYAEAKFYLVSALLYYALGPSRLLQGLAAIACFAAGIGLCFSILGWSWLSPVHKIMLHSSFYYFGWFAAGAYVHQHQNHGGRSYLLTAIVLASIAAILGSKLDTSRLTAGFVVISLFLLVMYRPAFQRMARARFLLILGAVSYPLYLLHENMMVSLIVQSGHLVPLIWSVFMPIPIMLLLASIAWVVARYIEKPSERRLRTWLLPSASVSHT